MEYLIPPWKHQLTAIERASKNDCQGFALFFEMGTGKTSTTINVLRHRFNEAKRVLRTLVFCPPIVVQNWKHEFAKHSKLDPALVVPLVGSGKQRAARLGGVIESGRGAVCVTNYESLLMPELYDALKLWAPEVVIFDESHLCKDPKTKRTKAAIALVCGEVKKGGGYVRPPTPFRMILSGSPVTNSPMDLFSQFLLMDNGATFGKNFFAFRALFFRDKNAGMPKGRYFPDWQIRPGSMEEMNKLIYRSGMRVTKEECLDLPPLVRKRIETPLSPQQKKHYEEMKRDLVTYVESGAAVATLAITKALRLQQIVSGHLPLSDGKVVRFEGNPRREALVDLLRELTPTHKVIVWAIFKENYETIRSAFAEVGVEHVEVHGEVGQREKDEAVARFNSDPGVRGLIGHPRSGGVGIGLQAASYTIWFSRGFSLTDFQQAEARNHRGGSEIHEKITSIDLVAPNTMDDLVLNALANKIKISDTVLRDMSLELKKLET